MITVIIYVVNAYAFVSRLTSPFLIIVGVRLFVEGGGLVEGFTGPYL
jgi:hypothetical protein